MSSYLEFFRNNIQIEGDNFEIRGTCYEMCPKKEIDLRTEENLIHILETLGSERKLVKSYSRSAADSNMAIPNLLRPYSVLRYTVQYLILEVTKRRDVSTVIVYDFVNDRLRAVRQDMTIQRLPAGECVNLLEPMVRFYVFYGYKLCRAPIQEFDPVLNRKHLLECLKLYLKCYDSSQGKMLELTSFLSGLDIQDKYHLQCDKVLMECLYLLCNLDDSYPLVRYLGLRKDLKCNTSIQLSYQIAIANLKGNFVEVCKLLDRLCPLTYCALCLYLPTLQRRALRVLCHAYSNKTAGVPSDTVCRWLHFNSGAEAERVCSHYGLSAHNGDVKFHKTHFRNDVPLLQPTHVDRLEEKCNLSIDNVFTYRLI